MRAAAVRGGAAAVREQRTETSEGAIGRGRERKKKLTAVGLGRPGPILLPLRLLLDSLDAVDFKRRRLLQLARDELQILDRRRSRLASRHRLRIRRSGVGVLLLLPFLRL